MATWTATGSTDTGSLALVAGGTKSYMDEVLLADPSTKETGLLGTTTNSVVVFAAGSNETGGEVVAYRNNSDNTFNVYSGGVEDFSIDMLQGGPTPGDYPTTTLSTMLDSTNGGDTATMYEPRAAVVDDGLVIVICAVHDYITAGSPDPTLVGSWDADNRVALVWKKIGDSSWNVVEDDTNAMAASIGNIWMLGRPIRPDTDTLLVGWTNYTTNNASNGEPRAYVSKFTGGDTTWTHAASVEILSSSDAAVNVSPVDLHFHSVALDYDASRSDGEVLRAFLFAGDVNDQNGCFEISRGDLTIDDDSTTKGAGITVEDATGSTSWERRGWVYSGQTQANSGTGLMYPGHFQPTYALKINDRFHCGSDESVPAIISFDGSAVAGTALAMETEYLPQPVSQGTDANRWLTLSGDVDNYTTATKGAGAVFPSASWKTATEQAKAGRIAYHNGTAWSSIAKPTDDRGLGVSPDGSVIVGSTSLGIIRYTPGDIAAYTPIISSPGATNVMNGTVSGNAFAGITTFSTQSGSDAGVPGLTSSHTAARFTFVPTTNAGAIFGDLYILPANMSDTLNDGDYFQMRVWLKSYGARGMEIFVKPTANTTGGQIQVSQAMPDVGYRLDTNEWAEASWCLEMDYARDTGSGATNYGLRMRMNTRSYPGSVISVPDVEVAIEGLYINPPQRVLQRPGLTGSGTATLADTDLVWTLPASPFPLVAKGITHPDGGSSAESFLTDDPFFFRLSAPDTGGGANYIDIKADYSAATLAYTAVLDGSTVATDEVIQSSVEFIKATPVTVKFSVVGTGLLMQSSISGEPYNAGVTLNTAATVAWDTLTQDDGTNQGELMMASITAGSEGNPGATAGKLIAMNII